ncbi:cation transporter, partial [Lactobacillus sp. XV13L]|nr:cation transporter [Lactobacillus sp. XV13L]
MKDHTARRYAYVTALNVVITIAEFIGGFVSGSLALLSDAVHNLSDVGAIIISFVARLISNRASNRRKTFGYDRAETLAAFTNGIILILISV